MKVDLVGIQATGVDVAARHPRRENGPEVGLWDAPHDLGEADFFEQYNGAAALDDIPEQLAVLEQLGGKDRIGHAVDFVAAHAAENPYEPRSSEPGE